MLGGSDNEGIPVALVCDHIVAHLYRQPGWEELAPGSEQGQGNILKESRLGLGNVDGVTVA